MFWRGVGAAMREAGRVVVGAEIFGVWVIGDCGVLAVPQCRHVGRHWGAQRIREVGSATSLRLVAPPEVSAAHRLLAWADAVWVSAAVPVLFREPMGGESGDGGYGGRELPGVGGCGGAL